MSTHLPIRIIRPLHRQCLFQCSSTRQFSTTIPLQKKATPKPQAAPSPQALQHEAFSDDANLPDDFGLISGTFVRAPLTKLPVKNPMQWIQYEWNFIKSKFKAYISLYKYKYMTDRKPSLDVNLLRDKNLRERAFLNYQHLYRAFARNDEKRIAELCLTSVAGEFRKRIQNRPMNLQMEWNILKPDFRKSTKVVSNRAAELNLPGCPQTAIRQVVVRITTRQTLQTKKKPGPVTDDALGQYQKKKKRALVWTPDGQASAEECVQENNSIFTAPRTEKVTEEQVTEFLVLQRQVLRGAEKDWKIWGFAEETTLNSIKSDEEYEKRMVAYQTQN